MRLCAQTLCWAYARSVSWPPFSSVWLPGTGRTLGDAYGRRHAVSGPRRLHRPLRRTRAPARRPGRRGRATPSPHQRDPRRAVVDADITRGVVPKSMGGRGLGLPSLCPGTRILAHGCPAKAWTVSFFMLHAWLRTEFPAEIHPLLSAAAEYRRARRRWRRPVPQRAPMVATWWPGVGTTPGASSTPTG